MDAWDHQRALLTLNRIHQSPFSIVPSTHVQKRQHARPDLTGPWDTALFCFLIHTSCCSERFRLIQRLLCIGCLHTAALESMAVLSLGFHKTRPNSASSHPPAFLIPGQLGSLFSSLPELTLCLNSWLSQSLFRPVKHVQTSWEFGYYLLSKFT